MSQRALRKYNTIVGIRVTTPSAKIVKKLQSKRCLTIYLVASREYTYKISGRCMSFRSRGKISNFVVRNFSYGVEQRIFINNPRLDIYL